MGEKLAVEIRVNATGRGTLLVNGVDLSNRVAMASFETIACRVTKLTLVLHADEVALNGEAIVAVKQAE